MPFTYCILQIILFTSTIILTSTTPSTSNTPLPSRPFEKVYAFGDAETDTGNTNSTTGPTIFRFVSDDPYGKTFFGRPTNRYSDGRLMIDFVAEALSIPYLPPYRNKKGDRSHGVNFATAGSTALTYKFFVTNNLTLDIVPVSLETQLGWFNEFLETERCKGSLATLKCKQEFVNNALFWVGDIGANDYAYSFKSSVPAKTIREMATNNIVGFLEILLNNGTKYIVVQGIRPTGCLTISLVNTPSTDRDENGCAASVNRRIDAHNKVLLRKLNNLKKKYPKALIVYADYYNAFLHVFRNSTSYGFVEKFKACCGSGGGLYNFDELFACGSPPSTACDKPSQYISWDGGHSTEAMYKIIAELVINGEYSEPPFSYLLRKKIKSG